ncbi:MAG: cytochrome c [Gammaproteobacteria bacterium]|nr:cytochrome c [Gammaproteobacteria bacterium]
MPRTELGRLTFAALLCAALTAPAGPVDAAGSLEDGNKKAAQCIACHGRDGLSRRPDVPHIAGQSEIYMKSQLRRFRSGERVHPEMNVIAKNLSDDDIDDLVAWYSSIEVEVKLPQ